MRARLGTTARGWLRRDGLPFADAQTSLFTNHVVWYPIKFDEFGNVPSATLYITGSTVAGTTHADTCENWTINTTGASWRGGSIYGGPQAWLSGALGTCATGPAPVLCMGKSRTTAVTITPAAGRKIWLTNTNFLIDGTNTPDQQCQTERPTGVTRARAFVATMSRSAASVLDMAATYVRPDGIVVGTGAQLAAGGELPSSFWQKADLTYTIPDLSYRVWKGQTTPNEVGTAATTCNDWTSEAGTGNFGGAFYTNRPAESQNRNCTFDSRMACVEVP